MPRPKRPAETWAVRVNFTMPPEDAARVQELAELVAPPGEAPNASLAVRVAVREALEKRRPPPAAGRAKPTGRR